MCCLHAWIAHPQGLKNDYNKRTMMLLISDIGTIVMGITAAICDDYKKVGWGGRVWLLL